MTRYFSMNLKSLLRSPELIFWSVAFMEFWVFMWVFVFGREVPPEHLKYYVGNGYGAMYTLAISSAGVGVVYGGLAASRSIRFLTKYSRLSPSRFFLENMLSSYIFLLIIGGIMFGSMVALFRAHKGVWALPEIPGGLAGMMLLGALEVYLFSMCCAFLAVALRSPGSAKFMCYLPLIFGFLAYGSLWADYGAGNYILPFNPILSLCYHYFTGKTPEASPFVGGGGGELHLHLLLASLLSWIGALAVLDILLFRRARGISAEEILALGS